MDTTELLGGFEQVSALPSRYVSRRASANGAGTTQRTDREVFFIGTKDETQFFG